MQIIEVTSKELWDGYLSNFPYSTLFLSWEWREFEKKLGNTFLNFAIFDKENLIGLLPIKVIRARRGDYLHVRHGPLLHKYDQVTFEYLREFLQAKCKELGAAFFRISPLVHEDLNIVSMYKSLGFVPALTHSTDAELTLVIDLTEEQDKIFSDFRKTTRNLIRKAQNLGIEVKQSSDLSLFDDFAAAYIDTVSRNKWNAYSLNYIRNECETFAKNSDLYIFVSYYEGKPISGAVFIKHRNQVIYHHGGSLSAYRSIPAAYLLHWQAITYFKSLGLTQYNFWGVSPKDASSHPWANLSLFKRGFSDIELKFMHAHDYIVSMRAHLTRGFELLESKLRGY